MKYPNPTRHKSSQELLSRIFIILEVFRHPNSNSFLSKTRCLALLEWTKTVKPLQCKHHAFPEPETAEM